MADKNNDQPPPDVGGTTIAVPDAVTLNGYSDDEVHRVAVTDEEIAQK